MNATEDFLQWFRKANHDEGMVRLGLDSGEEYTDSICFHCQQSVEKNLKGLLVMLGVIFTRTHSLMLLLGHVTEEIDVPQSIIQAAAMLEPYSVAVRYPSDDADPTYDDAKMAASCRSSFMGLGKWERHMPC